MNNRKNLSNASLSNKKIVLATHTRLATGTSEELEKYLKTRSQELINIAHPFSYCDNPRTFVNIYKNGIHLKKIYAPLIKGPEVIYFIKDVIFNVFYVLSLRSKFNIFIGIDNLNAFCGLILKKLKIVDTVIFYTIDYVPRRFKNKLLNNIYHFIDRICCYHCDFAWNLSPKMEEARYNNKISKAKCIPQFVVPNGNNFYQIKRLPVSEINRYSIVHMGHLLKKQGVQLIIDVLPEIIKKVPKASLSILGTGPFESDLQAQVKRLDLEGYVKFFGFIEDHSELEKILTRCAIGVATYVTEPDNYSYFADPGKPKTYMACGLPVIITRVPDIAREIEANKAGFAIEYDAEELKSAFLKLLCDDKLYEEYRYNAINFAARFDWTEIFNTAFRKEVKIGGSTLLTTNHESSRRIGSCNAGK